MPPPSSDCPSALPPAVAAWLKRQTAEVREAAAAVLDAPAARACATLLADLDIAVPSGGYFLTAVDLLDNAGALALQLGVSHYRTEGPLHAFLSLAGTAMFGDRSAIERFERDFRPDARIDDVLLYLHAELEMLDDGFAGE